MGKAARWLRGLLGGKKQAATPPGDDAAPPKERRRWGLARSFRDKEQLQQQQQRRGDGRSPSAAAEVASSTGAPRSCASSAASSYAAFAPSRYTPAAPALDEDEQSKRAIAVAAATAAMAEAAVAAAQAAAAVVRLTSSGRCPGLYTAAGRKADEWAAVKIQAAFRGYLARRALRALRALVKLQALVRGHIVRKETAEAMRCMQALVRVQARARACRALSENGQRRRASRQTHPGPPTPQKFEPTIRSNSVRHERGSNLKVHILSDPLLRNISLQPSNAWCHRATLWLCMVVARMQRNAPRPDNAEHLHPDRIQTSYNWLDRWMEERYWDSSREVSSRTGGATDDERNDRILEVDTGKPHLNPRRRAAQHSSSSLASAQNSRSFATMQNSPSNYSTTAQLSIPSPSSVDMEQHSLSPLRFVVGDGETCNSPQFYSATSRPGSARRGPFTPTKSECSRSFFSGYADYPNYMANTESSRAKVRSHSAPRQRPEYEKPTSVNWIPAPGPASGGGGQSSSSSSQRSVSQHLKFAGKAYPGSGRLDRLGMPVRY